MNIWFEIDSWQREDFFSGSMFRKHWSKTGTCSMKKPMVLPSNMQSSRPCPRIAMTHKHSSRMILLQWTQPSIFFLLSPPASSSFEVTRREEGGSSSGRDKFFTSALLLTLSIEGDFSQNQSMVGPRDGSLSSLEQPRARTSRLEWKRPQRVAQTDRRLQWSGKTYCSSLWACQRDASMEELLPRPRSTFTTLTRLLLVCVRVLSLQPSRIWKHLYKSIEPQVKRCLHYSWIV